MKSHCVYSYQIRAGGTLGLQKFSDLHVPEAADDSGADGMRVDRDGRMYVSTRLRIQVCDQAGKVTCIIPTANGHVSNLTFGGPNFDVLFATCGKQMYKRRVKVHGYNAFEAQVKPAAPKLLGSSPLNLVSPQHRRYALFLSNSRKAHTFGVAAKHLNGCVGSLIAS
jgi:sugar lactone lactonase YvrE